MPPCNPIDSSDVTLPSVPDGFAGGLVPQLPPLNIPFDNLPIENLLELFESINLILPSGILRPHLSDNYSKSVLDAILSLLEKFMPFLMMYTFFMPILNMILCIIEILCAINNPFKLVKALIRLFRVCIPEFLALFPFFALILMILSLLLLILALIIALIERILAIIEQIIANIRLLAQAIVTVDDDSIIAITIKLGDILCILANAFVLLGVIVMIFQIIEKLINLIFRIPPCDDDDGGDDGCCTPSVCPSFIKNNKQIVSTTGSLQYFNDVIKTGLTPATLRVSSFQLYDASASIPKSFNNITHAFDLPPGTSQNFFPQGDVYTSNTNPDSVPYTADVRIFYNPAFFGRNDIKGSRFIRIKNCVVLKQPVDGVLNYESKLIPPNNGTCFIGGGMAYEDDGITGMKVLPTDDAVGTLDSVVHLDDIVSTNPILLPTDGVLFDQIEYTFKINHLILIAKSLITVGCHPDVAFNKNFINNTIGAQLNGNSDALQQLPLPDVQATQDCVISAINEFRDNVSIETANELQTKLVDCLTDLKNKTTEAIEGVVNIGFDPYKSDFKLDPSIQFTTKPINIVVSLNESSGTSIANNLPADIAKNIAKNIQAKVTLGTVGHFDYDGTSAFIGQIKSLLPGNGKAQVSYNGEMISILNNPTDTTQTPSVTVKELMYTFIQSSSLGSGSNVERDEGDVSRDSSGGVE